MKYFSFNNKKDWEDFLEKVLKKYYESRKISRDFYVKNQNKWEELNELVSSYDEEHPLDSKYKIYEEQLNNMYYFKQLFNSENKFHISDKNLELSEADTLAFAIYSDILAIKFLNEDIYNEVIKFSSNLEFSEKNMFVLYDKFVNKFNDNYPIDFEELSEIIKKEIEFLDALYFWSRYKSKDEFLKIFNEVNDK